MTTIADAVACDDIKQDKLYNAAKQIRDARCLPQATKDALVKHISDARAKHPKAEPCAAPAAPAIPDTRPSKFSAATAKVAKAASA